MTASSYNPAEAYQNSKQSIKRWPGARTTAASVAVNVTLFLIYLSPNIATSIFRKPCALLLVTTFGKTTYHNILQSFLECSQNQPALQATTAARIVWIRRTRNSRLTLCTHAYPCLNQPVRPHHEQPASGPHSRPIKHIVLLR